MIKFPELVYHSTCHVLDPVVFPAGIKLILLKGSCYNQFLKVLGPVLSLLLHCHPDDGIWFGDFSFK